MDTTNSMDLHLQTFILKMSLTLKYFWYLNYHVIILRYKFEHAIYTIKVQGWGI